MNLVALIPSRAGSKRLPGKNVTRLLGESPLIVWTIETAKASGVFDRIYVCSDALAQKALAEEHGVDFILRSHSYDNEQDIQWIRPALSSLSPRPKAFSILRMTSPFRSPDMLQRAVAAFRQHQPMDSLRAVTPTSQHPGKMWVIQNNRLLPLCPFERDGVAWHSSPTQTLPAVYQQTASFEMAWTNTALAGGSIAGTNIMPFIVEGWDAFDINSADDWDRAEAHARTLLARVP